MSQSRVLPLFPKQKPIEIPSVEPREQKDQHTEPDRERDTKRSLSTVDKQEFVELFSNVLKTMMQSEDPEKQSLIQNIKNLDTKTIAEKCESVDVGKSVDKYRDAKVQREEKDQNEELSVSDTEHERECNAEDQGDSDDVISVLRVNRTARRLLPVTMRDNPNVSTTVPRQRGQYLEPLDQLRITTLCLLFEWGFMWNDWGLH